MKASFDRYSPRRRLLQEIEYGRALARRIRAVGPDVVVFCQTPPLSQAIASRACARRAIPVVFWQQDIYSVGIAAVASRRFNPILARPVAWAASALERRLAREATKVVAISPMFLPYLTRWGVRSRTSVIPNWAPIDDIPCMPRDNSWAREHGLEDRPVVLYSGTLGLKHDPTVFIRLAEDMARINPEARLVVISEGSGRDWLEARTRKQALPNMLLLDYQPFHAFPNVLGSADVLVATLDAAAGAYSVPSKVLSYLCAGRPIVGVLPRSNGASVTLLDSGGGIVVDPTDFPAATAAVIDLLGDAARRYAMGRAARAYAEDAFDITAVGGEFEQVLKAAIDGPKRCA